MRSSIITSLYQRLACTITLAFIAMAFSVYWWSCNVSQSASYQAEQKLHLELAAHLTHDNPLLHDGVYDKAALENLFHTLMLLGPAFEFYFLDPQGNILTYSADPAKIKRKTVDLTPIKTLLANQGSLPMFADDPKSLNKQKIFSASPVFSNKNSTNGHYETKLQGYLYVIIGGEKYDSVVGNIKQNQQLWQQTLVLLGAVILLLLLLLLLFRFFTYPIRQLSKEMDSLRAANFDKSTLNLTIWDKNSTSEIDKLGVSFNVMVDQINHQLQQLTHNDKIRRELLAHLSHDLRTPLAAMKGYIELLAINNNTLNEEERNQYIKTVQRNAEQLKLLIDQIFELAHLEDGQVAINSEPFPIGELLQDIQAKFAIKASSKNIDLKVLPAQCRYLVHSDIAKLERILTNLIENAIRHTPINGEITIKVEAQNSNGNDNITDKVNISVIDTGNGIAQDELAYIFDARYRASNAQGKSNKHAGLGLAISKRLSQLLHCDLSVKSKLGEGCAFSLTLSSVK